MKNRRFLLLLLLLLCFSAALTACNKKEAVKEEGSIKLYYFNKTETGFEVVGYDSEETDPVKLAKELIYKLSDTTKENTDKFKPSITKDTVVNDITLNGNEANIDFGAGYSQLPTKIEALSRAAVVKTLIQIPQITGITFSIDGEPLTGENDVPVGVMDKKTFMINNDEIYTYQKNVNLYYSNPTGDGLVKVEKKVTCEDNMPLEQAALLALLSPPDDNKVISPLPQTTEVIETQVTGNVCYVNLSDDIINDLTNVKVEIMVYAMVNTITDMGRANTVYFTIEGQARSELHGMKDFDKMKTFDHQLCK